jgi:hypothetical protein
LLLGITAIVFVITVQFSTVSRVSPSVPARRQTGYPTGVANSNHGQTVLTDEKNDDDANSNDNDDDIFVAPKETDDDDAKEEEDATEEEATEEQSVTRTEAPEKQSNTKQSTEPPQQGIRIPDTSFDPPPINSTSIRSWGCARNETPFIFVHIGKVQ